MDHSYQWQGRHDGSGDAHLRMYHLLNQTDHQAAQFALIGFSSDEGVRRNQGRIGAALAPDLIRKQLANLPVHHPVSIQDFGTVICENGELEQAQTKLASQIELAFQNGSKPIVLGGGHEVAFGSFSGIFQHQQKSDHTQKIGIINFDAHFDLRDDEQATSGTPFLQAAQLSAQFGQEFHYLCIGVAQHSNTKKLFDTAHELNCQYIFDHEVSIENLVKLFTQIEKFSQKVDVLYVTVDLDVFSASIAPGVSAPAVKGIDLKIFDRLFYHIQRTGKVKLLDIAECNPHYDQDQLTARLAAYIVYSYIFNDV